MWDDAGALGRLTRRLLVLMTFLLIGSGIAWLYNSKYFPVKQIAIQGKLKYASSKELQTVAREHIRGNMFRADIDSAQAAFQELPWIDSAMVRRRFPETVEIILTERVPVAHWRAGGLVDSKGNVFAASLKQGLPIFEGQQGTGKDMVKHYADFSGILSPLKLTIKELIYTPRSAWLLVLNNGIT
ncbi:cell division protein FtsQ/DivIB, partial [Neisseria sp. P0001.S004]